MQILAIAILVALIGTVLYFVFRKTTADDVATLGIGCPAMALQMISGVVLVISIVVFLVSTILLAAGARRETLNQIFVGSIVVGILSFVLFGISMWLQEGVGIDP